MSNLPWFRMYTEAVDDAKLGLLAFEDRWHFIALLCCKGQGLLDDDCNNSLMRRKIAVKLKLDVRELSEVSRRLAEVGLIDADTLQPVKWEKRQYIADNKKVDSEESGNYRGYIYFIGEEHGLTVKIGYSKNPWARVKDFQSASPSKLSVIATVRTTEVSETHIHSLFKPNKVSGEWYRVTCEITNIIKKIKDKSISTCEDIENYVATTRSCYVPTTTDVDVDVDLEVDLESTLCDHTQKSKNNPPSYIQNPTTAGLCCRSMVQNGVQGCNPSHPTLIALIEAGATELEFAAATRSAVERGKPSFAYVVGTVKRQREDAAKLVLHKGRLPTKQEALEQSNRAATAGWVPPEMRGLRNAN